MTEEEKESPVLPRDSGDPLGYLIIPIFGVILVAVILLWLNQKEEDGGVKFYPVTGQVTLNKKPLQGRFRILFYPNDGSDNPFSSAVLNERDGTYELVGNRRHIIGAKPGEYRVVVQMFEGPNEAWRIQASREGKVKFDPKDGGTLAPEDPDPPFDKDYSNAFKTPQRAVVSETDNVINFDLPLPPKAVKYSPKKSNEGQQESKYTPIEQRDQNGLDKNNKLDQNKKAESTGPDAKSLNSSPEKTAPGK